MTIPLLYVRPDGMQVAAYLHREARGCLVSLVAYDEDMRPRDSWDGQWASAPERFAQVKLLPFERSSAAYEAGFAMSCDEQAEAHYAAEREYYA